MRRLDIASGGLAVVMTVSARDADGAPAGSEVDPFSAALVAGTLTARGVIDSVSTAGSSLEVDLVASLGDTLQRAAHPDESERVDSMLEAMRQHGTAAGSFRVPHPEQGWVRCDCQLFSVQSGPPDARVDAYAFVLSASVSNKAMLEKITRLERHIRRIGSEVHAADLEHTVRPTTDHDLGSVLDGLGLTGRQRAIVERLAQGQRVASIAAALYISRSTVRNHLAQVYRLVGVHSQEELLNSLRRD